MDLSGFHRHTHKYMSDRVWTPKVPAPRVPGHAKDQSQGYER